MPVVVLSFRITFHDSKTALESQLYAVVSLLIFSNNFVALLHFKNVI